MVRVNVVVDTDDCPLFPKLANAKTQVQKMQLSHVIFDRQFSQFDKKLRSKSGQGFISFREGLPALWEGYKEDLRKEALFRLDAQSWKRKDIGTGRILQRAIDAIEINVPKRKISNNLVDWPNIYGHQYQSHRALLDAKSKRSARYQLEKWFFEFFKGSKSSEEAFESFRALAGNRYDIIAYLFYLKDWNRFMPIATQTFDKAFRLLNGDLVTSRHCSWENYSRYNDVLSAVQKCLRDFQGIRDARLIDAHSFCWMLVRLEVAETTAKRVIPLPSPVDKIEDLEIKESKIPEDGEFDPVDDEEFFTRHARNCQLGKLAQEIALESERKRVAKLDLSQKVVKPVWTEVKRGYDTLSCDEDGSARQIEVNAVRTSGKRLSFFLTAYEWRASRKLPNYYFYLVANVRSAKPKVLMIEATRVGQQHLRPTDYVSSFAADF